MHRELIAQKYDGSQKRGPGRPPSGGDIEALVTWKEILDQARENDRGSRFFTVDVWTKRGLQRFIILFFIELSTRKVETAGIASNANGLWMAQIGRNLTNRC